MSRPRHRQHAPRPRPPYGDRLRAAMDEHGPLCAGIDPHRRAARAVGPARRPSPGSSVRADLRRGVRRRASPRSSRSRPSSSVFGSAGVAVLERDPRRPARRRHAVAARRQARRHRLDDGRLRPGLPRPTASPLRADAHHREPLPRLRVAAAGARPRRGDRARASSCSTLTSNPEGRSVQHATPRRRHGRGLGRGGRRRATTRRAAASGRLGSVGLVVGATVGSAVTDLGLDLAGAARPAARPGLGRPGRHAGGPARRLRRRAAPGARHEQPRGARGRPGRRGAARPPRAGPPSDLAAALTAERAARRRSPRSLRRSDAAGSSRRPSR